MRERFLPVLVGAVLVAGFGGLMMGADEGGSGGGGPAVMALFVGLAGGAGLLVRRVSTGATVADRSWSAAGAAPAPEASGPRPIPSDWAVARALGRVEARELASSGSFGVGIGFCGLLLLLFGIVWSPENTEPWFRFAPAAPWYCLPLTGMSVLAAHRAVTRAGRDGTAELFDSCPAEPTTRTLGFLLTAAVPVLVLVASGAALTAAIAVRSPHVYGPLDADDWTDVVTAVLLGAGGVALGVALGRWIRFSLAPVVAVVAVGFAGLAINDVGGHEWNPYTLLAMAPTVDWQSPVFVARPALWHLGWVLGLTAAVALVALGRHRRDRTMGRLAILTVSLVVASGIGATRPMSSGSAERIATAVAEPGAMQDCTTTGPVRLCLYPVHRPLQKKVLRDIAPIAAVIPSAAGRLTLRQRFDGDLADLPPEVRRRLGEEDLVVPDGEVPLGASEDFGYAIGSAGYQLALGAVGLPTRTGDDLLPAVVAGQARGVVALWLATRGRTADEVVELTTSPFPGSSAAFDRGSLEEPGDCSVPTVVWSAQDLAAARSVVALPSDEVAAVVEAGWLRWLDPTTGTDELLTALGLGTVGPFDRVQARPGNPC